VAVRYRRRRRRAASTDHAWSVEAEPRCRLARSSRHWSSRSTVSAIALSSPSLFIASTSVRESTAQAVAVACIFVVCGAESPRAARTRSSEEYQLGLLVTDWGHVFSST
jgi:hypothetical protein